MLENVFSKNPLLQCKLLNNKTKEKSCGPLSFMSLIFPRSIFSIFIIRMQIWPEVFFFRENSLCLLYRSTLSLFMCFTGINLMVSQLNLCSCMELQLELIFAPGHVEVSQVHSTTSALSVTQYVRAYRPGSICRVVPLHWGTFRR